MNEKNLKDDSGAITVWLTLLLVGMLSFVSLVIECIRYNLSESICFQSGKLATISAMADYEPDIFENYHIFALDISYGSEVVNEKRLKNNISKYSNMSLKPSCIDDEGSTKDMMGCSTNKIILSNINYLIDDTDNFVNQVCCYMREYRNDNKILDSVLEDSSSNRKKLFCSYIMTHFSSYKSTYILGYMKRKYVYEIEYILKGQNSDNKNMEMIMELFAGDDIDEENAEIVCEEEKYMQIMYTELLKVDIKLLVNRVQEIMVQNINETFNKNIQQKELITSVDVEIEYSVEPRATNIQLINQWLKNIYTKKYILYSEKFKY